MNSNGVCVVSYYNIMSQLKKFVNSNKSLEFKRKLNTLIQTNCLNIIQNPYGNYIIQHVLEVWDIEYCEEIIDIILKNIVSLSLQKFSSNVIDICFDIVKPVRNLFTLLQEQRQQLFKNLFNPEKISSIIKNKFGLVFSRKE